MNTIGFLIGDLKNAKVRAQETQQYLALVERRASINFLGLVSQRSFQMRDQLAKMQLEIDRLVEYCEEYERAVR